MATNARPTNRDRIAYHMAVRTLNGAGFFALEPDNYTVRDAAADLRAAARALVGLLRRAR